MVSNLCLEHSLNIIITSLIEENFRSRFFRTPQNPSMNFTHRLHYSLAVVVPPAAIHSPQVKLPLYFLSVLEIHIPLVVFLQVCIQLPIVKTLVGVVDSHVS